EVEDLEVVVPGRPGGERHPGRAVGDAGPADDRQRLLDVGPRVVLLQDGQHPVRQRLDGRDHEHAAGGPQLGEEVAALKDVLDLGGEVEGQRGELGVQGADHLQGVARAVEEVRVAEGDVGGA